MFDTLNTYYPKAKNTQNGENYRVLGSEVQYNSKVEVQCLVCGTITNSTSLSIFSGQLPCKCGKGYYRTDERRLERLIEITKNTDLVIDYSAIEAIKNVKQRIHIRCRCCDYIWDASYSSVVRKTTGCSRCSNVTRYTDEEYIAKINLLPKVRFLTKTTEKIGRSTHVIVACNTCENQFSASVGNLLQDRGCSKCAEYGYNTRESGYLYILSLKLDNIVVGYKFGITNCPKDRISRLIKASKLEVRPIFVFNFLDGKHAFELEGKIKKSFGNFLPKNLVPDGFTETISPQEVTHLLQFIQYEVNKLE